MLARLLLCEVYACGQKKASAYCERGKKCTALPRTYYRYWCCNNSMVFGQKPLPSTEVTRWGFGQLNFSVSEGTGEWVMDYTNARKH